MKKFLLLGALALCGANAVVANETTVLTSIESCYVDATDDNINENYNGANLDNLTAYYTQFRDWSSGYDGTVKFNSGACLPLWKFDIQDFEDFDFTIVKATLTVTCNSTGDSGNNYNIRLLGYNGEWDANDLTYTGLTNAGSGTLTGLATTSASEQSFQPLDETTAWSTGTTFPVELSEECTTYFKSAIFLDEDTEFNQYLSFAVASNTARYMYMDPTATLTIEYTKSEVADVPLQYVDSLTGNIVKTGLSTAVNTVGNDIVLTDEDLADFFDEFDQKWIVTSTNLDEHNDEQPCIEDDDENTITIYVRAAELIDYTINAVYTDEEAEDEENAEVILATLASGSAFEGESVYYTYATYINVDGTLYSATKQSSNPWWGVTTTMGDETPYIETVTYSITEIENVVFFAEAEDLWYLTSSTASNADIRCSMGTGAYAADTVTVVTLPEGTYTMTVGVWGNTGVDFEFLLGTDTMLVASTLGWYQTYTSEEITIFGATDLVLNAAGTTGKLIDWIYIQSDDADIEEIVIPDGIKAVAEEATEQKLTGIYDLAGRKVAAPKKGLYIIDGKKVLY